MSVPTNENMDSEEVADMKTTNIDNLAVLMTNDEAMDGLEREIAQIHSCEPDDTVLPLPTYIERVENANDLEAELSANNDEHVLFEMQPPQQRIAKIPEVHSEDIEKLNNNAKVQGVTIEGEGEYQILEIDDDIEEQQQQEAPLSDSVANRTISNPINNKNNNNNNKTQYVAKLTREEERAMAMEQMACLNAVVDRRRRRTDKNIVAKTSATNATSAAANSIVAISTHKKLESAQKKKQILMKEVDADFIGLDNDNIKTNTNKIINNALKNKSNEKSTISTSTCEQIQKTQTNSCDSEEVDILLKKSVTTTTVTSDGTTTGPTATTATGFKRTRIIKRKIIWDPDAPETQFSFTKFARDKTAKLGNSNNNDNTKSVAEENTQTNGGNKLLKTKKKDRSKEQSTTSAGPLRTAATNLKKKKPSEIERLLGDEGAANMVNDVQDKQKKCISQRTDCKRAASSSRDSVMCNLNNSIKYHSSPSTRRNLIRTVDSVCIPTDTTMPVMKAYPSNVWQHVYNDQNVESVIVRRRSMSSHSSIGSVIATNQNINTGRINNSGARNLNNRPACAITATTDTYTDMHNDSINDDVDFDDTSRIKNSIPLRRQTINNFNFATSGVGNRSVASISTTYANGDYMDEEFEDTTINSGCPINTGNINSRNRQTISVGNRVRLSAAAASKVGLRVTPTATVTSSTIAQQLYEMTTEPSTSTAPKAGSQQRTRASATKQRTTAVQLVLPPHTRLANLPRNVGRQRQIESGLNNNKSQPRSTRVSHPKLSKLQDGSSTDSHLAVNIETLDIMTDPEVIENRPKKRKLRIGSGKVTPSTDQHQILRNARRMDELREGIRQIRRENRDIRARNNNTTTVENYEIVDRGGFKFDEQWYSLALNFWIKVYSNANDKETVGVNACEIWQRHYHNIFCLYFKYDINKKSHGRNYTVDAPFIETLAQEIQKCIENDDCKVIMLGTLSINFMRGIDFQSGLTSGHPTKRRERAEEFGASLKQLFSTIALCPKPILVGVKGVVRGFAVTMLPLFDAVICAHNTQFVTPYHKIGQLPEGFCFWKNQQGANNMLTKNLFQLGQSILADNAHNLGLVNKVVDVEDVHAETGYLAAEMLTVRPEIFRQIKEPSLKAYKNIIDTCLNAEMEQIVNEWCSQECLNNFREIASVGYQKKC